MKKGDALTSYTRRFREILGYDAHGNITAITHRGRNTATSWGVTDNLTLSYDGNRLAGVTNYYPFGTPYTQSAAVMGASLQPYK